MILTVAQFKEVAPDCGLSDVELFRRLSAIEAMIRAYTNNTFQVRTARRMGFVIAGRIALEASPFCVGDTIQISDNPDNQGLYVIEAIGSGEIEVSPEPRASNDLFIVTRIQYPLDIVNGAINLLKWDLNNREKVGIKQETISRHSVTYFDMDANSECGYPKALLGFLKPYKKVRF